MYPILGILAKLVLSVGGKYLRERVEQEVKERFMDIPTVLDKYTHEMLHIVKLLKQMVDSNKCSEDRATNMFNALFDTSNSYSDLLKVLNVKQSELSNSPLTTWQYLKLLDAML